MVSLGHEGTMEKGGFGWFLVGFGWRIFYYAIKLFYNFSLVPICDISVVVWGLMVAGVLGITTEDYE
jgi:hypothetical protein